MNINFCSNTDIPFIKQGDTMTGAKRLICGLITPVRTVFIRSICWRSWERPGEIGRKWSITGTSCWTNGLKYLRPPWTRWKLKSGACLKTNRILTTYRWEKNWFYGLQEDWSGVWLPDKVWWSGRWLWKKRSGSLIPVRLRHRWCSWLLCRSTGVSAPIKHSCCLRLI